MASLEESTILSFSSISFIFSSTWPTTVLIYSSDIPSTEGNFIRRPLILASNSLFCIVVLEQAGLHVIGFFYLRADALQPAAHFRLEVGQLPRGGGIGSGLIAGGAEQPHLLLQHLVLFLQFRYKFGSAVHLFFKALQRVMHR